MLGFPFDVDFNVSSITIVQRCCYSNQFIAYLRCSLISFGVICYSLMTAIKTRSVYKLTQILRTRKHLFFLLEIARRGLCQVQVT